MALLKHPSLAYMVALRTADCVMVASAGGFRRLGFETLSSLSFLRREARAKHSTHRGICSPLRHLARRQRMSSVEAGAAVFEVPSRITFQKRWRSVHSADDSTPSASASRAA